MESFDRFMESSRLTELNVRAFVEAIERARPVTEGVSIFDQAGPEVALPAVSDRLQRLFEARRSTRRFGADPITTKEIAAILATAGVGPDGRSVVASAGGLDPLALHAFVVRSDGSLHRRIVYYQPRTHTAGVLGELPDDDTVRSLFSLDCEGMPQLLLVYSIDPASTVAKYGERGGRFLLQQVGLAMANVGLRLAATERSRRRGRRLHGYVLGGVCDEVGDLLQLSHTRARIVGAYAVGR